jgi:hypothetical protein
MRQLGNAVPVGLGYAVAKRLAYVIHAADIKAQKVGRRSILVR